MCVSFCVIHFIQCYQISCVLLNFYYSNLPFIIRIFILIIGRILFELFYYFYRRHHLRSSSGPVLTCPLISPMPLVLWSTVSVGVPAGRFSCWAREISVSKVLCSVWKKSILWKTEFFTLYCSMWFKIPPDLLKGEWQWTLHALCDWW